MRAENLQGGDVILLRQIWHLLRENLHKLLQTSLPWHELIIQHAILVDTTTAWTPHIVQMETETKGVLPGDKCPRHCDNIFIQPFYFVTSINDQSARCFWVSFKE